MSVTVRREVVVPLTPEEVWPALTEPERMGQWFGADVQLDLRPGGEVVFRWPTPRDAGSSRRSSRAGDSPSAGRRRTPTVRRRR
jgi:uncharacterized protein YndB with AHSA1/START domain